MKRSTFLKSSLLTGSGIFLGLSSSLKSLASLKNGSIISLPLLVSRNFPIIATMTSQPASNCYCNGSSCSRNNAPVDNYYNQSNIWNILYDTRFLYYQYLNDPYYDPYYLTNASVPFFYSVDYPIMRIEGPSLYGLCNALNEYSRYSSKDIQAKDVFAPTQEYSNAGYRFDVEPCHETSYATKKGTTTINYSKQASKVRVVAENKPKGILYHDNTYNI